MSHTTCGNGWQKFVSEESHFITFFHIGPDRLSGGDLALCNLLRRFNSRLRDVLVYGDTKYWAARPFGRTANFLKEVREV